MTEIRNKAGGRPAKSRIDKQKRVDNATVEQAGCRHYPQAGRGSQQHQSTGAPGKCRRVRTGSGGTRETKEQDY